RRAAAGGRGPRARVGVSYAPIGAPAFGVASNAADPARAVDSSAAVRLMAAASDSHSAGAARLPVASIRYVATAGVKPPTLAVARLKAREKRAVRTAGGIISARNGIIAPLYIPKKNENHSSTISSLPKLGAATSHSIAG